MPDESTDTLAAVPLAALLALWRAAPDTARQQAVALGCPDLDPQVGPTGTARPGAAWRPLWQCWPPGGGHQPFDYDRIEITRREYAAPREVDPNALHPAMNVAGVYWRPAPDARLLRPPEPTQGPAGRSA